MTSDNQIAANRRNAQASTGPRSANGKNRSRRNALRHGLAAQTIVPALEDEVEYHAFAIALRSSYSRLSPVEQELAHRLASILWRLRRAGAIEAGLMQIQAEIQSQGKWVSGLRVMPTTSQALTVMGPQAVPTNEVCPKLTAQDAARCFLRITHSDNGAIERLGRYEAALWRQAAQLLLMLQHQIP